MNISLQKLLLKMEEELNLAQSAQSEAAQRERIQSIKTLCELVLDEPQQLGASKSGQRNSTQQQSVQQFVPAQPVFAQPQIPVSQQPSMVPQPKKLQMEDEANGDSLFDF
ncbi:YwdI family protein [Mesobacillus jeotgali]|uniref:YwdI family protein n=1 Tax=Mesobacillus jeotgali TaxID=129985 RepID=UPI0009A79BE7|nr:YwdI family protein [Mesobacillus jeotgali]